MGELADVAHWIDARLNAAIGVIEVARVGVVLGVPVPLVGVQAAVPTEPVTTSQDDEKQAGLQGSPEHPARLPRSCAAVISVK